MKAFADMMPVIRHPRCFNCHGGFDVLADAHPGADVAKESGLNPRERLTAPQIKKFHEGCKDCHDNIKGKAVRLDGTELEGWRVAPEPMLWDGKSDEELCRKLKQFEPTGAQFVDHLVTDHQEVQFVEAAFNGDRALGEQGLKDYGLRAEPPPGTWSELIAKGQKWVDILGEQYATPECGCAKPKLELTMKTEVSGSTDGGALTGEMSSTVKLTADSSGLVYRGEAPLQHGRYTAPTPPGCAVTWAPEGGVLAVKEARFDAADDGRLTTSLTVYPSNSGGTMTMRCPNLPQTVVVPVLPLAQEWRFVHDAERVGLDYRFGEFEAPSGAISGGGRTLVGRKDMSRTITRGGVRITAKTTFEFWSVPDQ